MVSWIGDIKIKIANTKALKINDRNFENLEFDVINLCVGGELSGHLTLYRDKF